MPKKIGGRIYLHGDYIKSLDNRLLDAVIDARELAEDTLGNFQWNTVRIKPDGTGGATEVAFQYAPDFDYDDEPEVMQTVAVSNGEVHIRQHKNTIWHHKWMWVDSNYKGFDYEASKARSTLWKPFVKKNDIPKIGNKKFWESIKSRWEGA